MCTGKSEPQGGTKTSESQSHMKVMQPMTWSCSTRLSTAAELGETTGIVYRLLGEAVAQSCRQGMRLRERNTHHRLAQISLISPNSNENEGTDGRRGDTYSVVVVVVVKRDVVGRDQGLRERRASAVLTQEDKQETKEYSTNKEKWPVAQGPATPSMSS